MSSNTIESNSSKPKCKSFRERIINYITVEWGEEIATTVRRELLEETGLELVCISRLAGVYSKPNRDPRVHSICVVVEAEVRGDIKIQDKQEISEVEAFNLKDLPSVRLSYDNGEQLKNYLDDLTILA